MNLHAEPSRGGPLQADWAREIARAVRRCVRAGHGLRLTETPDGAVISLAAHSGIPPRTSKGYPYGEQWNFGIRFDGAGIEVYPGIFYHAGIGYFWPGTSGELTLASLANGQHVCLRVVPASEGTPSIGIVASSSYSDSDGYVVRALCKVAVSGGTASLDQWYGGGIELGVMR